MKRYHVKALKNQPGSRRFSIVLGSAGVPFDLDETNPEAKTFPEKTLALNDNQVHSLKQSGKFDIRPAAEEKAVKPAPAAAAEKKE